MESIKQLAIIINHKTLIISLLAVTSTYLCKRYGLTADFPLTLIATAVVFPIVFAINSAYKRREVALLKYGAIKAHGRVIYFATRDWLENTNETIQQKAKTLLAELMTNIRTLLSNPISEMSGNEDKVYACISKLSSFIKISTSYFFDKFKGILFKTLTINRSRLKASIYINNLGLLRLIFFIY